MYNDARRRNTQTVSSLSIPKMEIFSRLTAFVSPDHSGRPQDPEVSVMCTEPNGESNCGVNCHKCCRWTKERVSNTVILRSPTKIGLTVSPWPWPTRLRTLTHTPYNPPSCPPHHNRTLTPSAVASPRHRITPFRTTVSTSYSAIQRNNPLSLSRADPSVPLPTSTCVCSRWPSIMSAKTQILK